MSVPNQQKIYSILLMELLNKMSNTICPMNPELYKKKKFRDVLFIMNNYTYIFYYMADSWIVLPQLLWSNHL